MIGRPGRRAERSARKPRLGFAVAVLALAVGACAADPPDGHRAADADRATTGITEPAAPTAAGGDEGEPAAADGAEAAETSATARFGEPGPWDLPYLFASDRSGSFEIHHRSAEGTIRQLTDDRDHDHWWPRLSPDGSVVMLLRSPVSARPVTGGVEASDREASLWTMRLDGSGLEELLPADRFDRLGTPSWSPDGERIIFAATDPEDGGWRLWSTPTDRVDPVPLTGSDRLFLDPTYSPDGTRIAYVAFPSGFRGRSDAVERLEVFTAASDGSDERRVTFDELMDRGPTWAPDGRSLAFETLTDPDRALVGAWSLRVHSLDDGRFVEVLADGNINTVSRWHPDRTGLFFQRYAFDRPGRHLAYVNLDGTGLTTLVEGSPDETSITIEPIFGPAALE